MLKAHGVVALRSKILVVDNESIILDFVTAVLGPVGYRIVAATCGRQANDLFHQHHPELALMLVELTVPLLGGVDFVSHLPTLTRRIPVVFTSALRERQPGGDICCDFPVLQKPFKASELRIAVKTAGLPVSLSEASY